MKRIKLPGRFRLCHRDKDRPALFDRDANDLAWEFLLNVGYEAALLSYDGTWWHRVTRPAPPTRRKKSAMRKEMKNVC